MKRALLAIFFLCALAALGVKAQLPAAWQNWHYARSIALEPASEPRLVRVVLPMAVYGQAQASLADVRVIDDAGNEVPHVLYARQGQKTREWRSARLSEVGFVPGRYTTLVVDTGEDDALHNSVEIETDEKDFMVWVGIAASDDRKSWRIVRERAPIYRFEKDGLEGTQAISYPETRSRWLRVRILEGEKQFPVRACRTALGKEIAGEGLNSLTRGFLHAGASSVVATLWSVDDRATAEFMARFYQRLLVEGVSPSRAMREAQLEMWESELWNAPFYWAGFVLEGEWLGHDAAQ